MSITRRNFIKLTSASASALALTACGTSSSEEAEAAKVSISVAVPNDTTNEARALMLLETTGFLTLKEGITITATKNDIESSDFDLNIDEVEAAQIPNILQDEDYAVINSNYALGAGIDPMTESLAMEDSTSPYVNILVCREGEETSDKIKALAAALCSEKVATFIDETYGGAVISTVEEPTDGYDESVDYDALNGTSVTCAATPAPHCEILEVAAEILAPKGITLIIQEYNDYIIPNNIVDDGTTDSNFFQHVPYLEAFNADYGTNLVNAAGIHLEPLGLYGGKQTTLDIITG